MKHDLHSHTNFSACANKNNTWESLLSKFEENKIEIASITDHNTCIFHVINLFKNTKKLFSGKIISGMECDVSHNGIGFELLAYDFDVMNTFNWAYQTYGTLETRQKQMADKLIQLAQEKGYELDLSIPMEKGQYAHNYIFSCFKKDSKKMESLLNDFNIKVSDDFYRASSGNKNFPLYLDMNTIYPSIKEVVDAIHKFGGKVILAHPYNYSSIDANILLDLAIKEKLDGIEVFHPSANEEQVEFLLDFAKKHNMLTTGGSDYHGTEKHNEVGIQNKNANEDLICFQ